METTLISKCCKAPATKWEAISELVDDDAYVCSKCDKKCEVTEVCAYCLGTGEVTVDEPVYTDEPWITAPIGVRKCICKVRHEYEDYEA